MRAKGRRGKGASREKGHKPATKKAPPPRPYEFLDHPADVGMEVRGRTLAELFGNAAEAMCDYGWELERVRPRQTIRIRARATKLEDLLYSWLSEILFLTDAERWVFKTFQVERVAQTPPALWEVVGAGRGERFAKSRHRSRTYIKAVTYHQLEVKQTPDGWQATVYLDV